MSIITVDVIAESLRQEPYCLFSWRRNCIGKSFRFRKMCRRIGVNARMVVCIGLARARPLGFRVRMFTVHAWGEVDGRRMEVATPHGKSGIWGIVDIHIKPVWGVWM